VDGFIQWMKTFVSEFIAMQELEECCRMRPDIPIKMPLLTVDRGNYSVPSWDKVKGIIEDAMMNTVLPVLRVDMPTIFKYLEEKIMEFNPRSTKAKKTVDIFRGIMSGRQEDFLVGPHCEAVLGVLATFFPDELAGKDEGLVCICKVLSRLRSYPRKTN